jgi:hypothetical protein
MSAANARGSARVSRAGFGVPQKRTFLTAIHPGIVMPTTKACDREDALPNPRDACATQII